jgi:hypothetical protein
MLFLEVRVKTSSQARMVTMLFLAEMEAIAFLVMQGTICFLVRKEKTACLEERG